jgi:dTDP-4-dehydrorhamnose reductase
MTIALKNLVGPWKMSPNKNRMQENKTRMLITGVSGLLGNNLAYYFREKYNVLGLYLSHSVNIKGIQTQRADLLSEVSFKNIVRDFNPDIIIHCASLADVDFCENNQELTDRINILGTKVVVESIKNQKTKLVYISSDSVYDGGKGNFSEKDLVNPQNYYGLSKYKGELEVLKKSEILILRTNIFGWNIQEKYSIAEWILHELSNKKQMKGFSDVFFSSIYNFDLAKILDIAINQNLTGLFNCGSSTSLSKYEFALCIADYFNLDKDLIQPISIDDFNLRAKRGKNLTLNVNELKNALNYNPPAISESIAAFYRDYRQGLPQKIRKDIVPHIAQIWQSL